MFAVDPDKIHRYVPKEARKLPVEEQPVFLIKILKAKDAAVIEDKSIIADLAKDDEVSNMRFFSGTTIIRTLKEGLKGWENFKLPDGTEAPWRENNGNPKPENFDFIPNKLRKELAEAISIGSFLDEDTEKNSD